MPHQVLVAHPSKTLSLSLSTHCASVLQPPLVPLTNMFCDHHDHPNVDLHFATSTNPNKSIFCDLRLAFSLSLSLLFLLIYIFSLECKNFCLVYICLRVEKMWESIRKFFFRAFSNFNNATKQLKCFSKHFLGTQPDTYFYKIFSPKNIFL